MDNTTSVLPDTRVAVLTSVSLSDFVNSIMESGYDTYVWWQGITFHDDAHRLIDSSFTVKHWSREYDGDTLPVPITKTTLTYRDLVNAWNELLHMNMRSMLINPYDIDIDADLADMVLQQAVYGCQVYA